MKKKTIGMKKPAFLVMAGTLALLNWTTPLMAQEMKASTQVSDTFNGKAGHSDKVKIADYINDHDSKSGKDSDNKDNSGEDMKNKNKSDNDIKIKADSENKISGEQNNGNNNNSNESSREAKSFVTDIMNESQGGKEKISFTIPDGEHDIEMEFTVVQKKGNDLVVFSKNKGKYNQGKYTIDLDLPKGEEKYDLEVSCKRAGDNRTMLWSRASLDKSWKNIEIKADGEKAVPVTSGAVITDVSNVSATGKTKIKFRVQKQQRPVELDFICYNQTGNGRAVLSKISGKFEEGEHTVDLDLPQANGNYDLEISAHASDNYSATLWSRAAQGEWKASYGNSVGLAAILLQKLLITSINIGTNGTTKTWKVENPSTESVTLHWKIDGTDQTGTQTVAAGQAATITANQDSNQNLLVSVVGERGYNVSIQPTVSSSNFATSAGGVSTPANSTPNNSSTGSAATPSGASPSTGGSSTADSTPSSTGGSSTSATAPAVDSASPSTTAPATDTASTTTPADSAATTTAVADVSMGGNNLNQPSGVQLAQLPQTGEKTPYGFYGAGALLALIGSLILRKRKNNV